MSKRELEVHASGDNYWNEGLQMLDQQVDLSFHDVVGQYCRTMVIGFALGEYRLEEIRKVTQWAGKLDGEASRLSREQELTGDDLIEFRARRLAHHSIRAARNVVSSDESIDIYVDRRDEELVQAYQMLKSRRHKVGVRRRYKHDSGTIN